MVDLNEDFEGTKQEVLVKEVSSDGESDHELNQESDQDSDLPKILIKKEPCEDPQPFLVLRG